MLEPCNAHTLPHIDTHPRQAAPARGGYPRYALSRLSEGLRTGMRGAFGVAPR